MLIIVIREEKYTFCYSLIFSLVAVLAYLQQQINNVTFDIIICHFMIYLTIYYHILLINLSLQRT